jgi:hypothetical protein
MSKWLMIILQMIPLEELFNFVLSLLRNLTKLTDTTVDDISVNSIYLILYHIKVIHSLPPDLLKLMDTFPP